MKKQKKGTKMNVKLEKQCQLTNLGKNMNRKYLIELFI
jgi:hypothetical protein